MKVTTLGIDLAKSIFRLHGVDARGVAVLRRQLTRKQLLPFLAKLSPCLVGTEAGSDAHFWAREIGKLGHEARLMSPHFVRPYIKSNKNDANDAEVICETVGRPSMRFVPSKSTVRPCDLFGGARVYSRVGGSIAKAYSDELLPNVVDWPVMIRRPPLVRSRLTE